LDNNLDPAVPRVPPCRRGQEPG